jgi:hypothetical protein
LLLHLPAERLCGLSCASHLVLGWPMFDMMAVANLAIGQAASFGTAASAVW